MPMPWRRQIVPRLGVHPELRGGAERGGEQLGGLRGDRASAPHDLVDPPDAHADMPRQRGLRDAEGTLERLGQDLAR